MQKQNEEYSPEGQSFSLEGIEKDRQETLKNRDRVLQNKKLLAWFEGLYRQMFEQKFKSEESLRVLEIGSGTSPLKKFYPQVITSDILPMGHIDLVFDAHKIDELNQVPDESLDVITMTNVLHHLERPIDFLNAAAIKLKPGGQVVLVEPFFSWISSLIFLYLHHEPTDFHVKNPIIERQFNPLGTANICLPHLIFFKHKAWLGMLGARYNLESLQIDHYSFITYALSGGVSRNFPVPTSLFKMILVVDRWLAKTFPRIFAFEFIAYLPKKKR